MEKPYVFISYSTRDQEYANKVHDTLTKHGINSWIATNEIHGGQSFAEEITDAIQNCKVFCLVLSQNSDQSPHVSNETSLAFSARKTIIPIRIQRFELSKNTTYFLQQAQWIDAYDDFSLALEQLVAQAKIALASETTQGQICTIPHLHASTENTLKRARFSLEDGDFLHANAFAEQALNINAECAEAYYIKLLCDYRVRDMGDLASIAFEENINYKRILCFGNEELKRNLDKLIVCRKQREIAEQEEREKRKIAEQEERKKRSEIAGKEMAREAEKKRAELAVKKQLLAEKRKSLAPYANLISASGHVLAVKTNGRVISYGDNEDRQRCVWGWNNIVAVSAGSFNSLGLKKNGRVVSAGEREWKQRKVGFWKNIVAVASGDVHSLGLRADGTVVVAHDPESYPINVSDWKNIIAVVAGPYSAFGLRADGTVVYSGGSSYELSDVNMWRDIVAISVSDDNREKCILGLKSDGSVVAVGNNDYGQCNTSGWQDIVAISVGSIHSLGLKLDGTVVACGSNDFGECDVSEWRDIVAISAGLATSYGLKADGTIIAIGRNGEKQCNINGRKIFKKTKSKTT